MSGIATLTYDAVQRLQNKDTKVCDTRKTTPGLRIFEKYAVTCGGGVNHRFGLYDGVMIKDNHITFCGSIEKAVAKVRKKLGPMDKIEVETESEADVIAAVKSDCDIIMFDNQTPDTIKNWHKHVLQTIVTAASGNIAFEYLASYGATADDFISLGYLFHCVTSLDISLRGL